MVFKLSYLRNYSVQFDETVTGYIKQLMVIYIYMVKMYMLFTLSYVVFKRI